MRIITYSDLHLEFGSGWMLPPAVNGDVMILAGDIVTLKDYEPLDPKNLNQAFDGRDGASPTMTRKPICRNKTSWAVGRVALS
jgi:hypothetical protein